MKGYSAPGVSFPSDELRRGHLTSRIPLRALAHNVTAAELLQMSPKRYDRRDRSIIIEALLILRVGKHSSFVLWRSRVQVTTGTLTEAVREI